MKKRSIGKLLVGVVLIFGAFAISVDIRESDWINQLVGVFQNILGK